MERGPMRDKTEPDLGVRSALGVDPLLSTAPEAS